MGLAACVKLGASSTLALQGPPRLLHCTEPQELSSFRLTLLADTSPAGILRNHLGQTADEHSHPSSPWETRRGPAMPTPSPGQSISSLQWRRRERVWDLCRRRCPQHERHGGGRRPRALPHLPARQHDGELMRSKVRGRRQPDNSLAPQAAGGAWAAEGRHLPPLPGISSLIMRLLLARCLTAGTSISRLLVLPIPTCGCGSGEAGREGWPCPRAWVWPGLRWEGGMVLTLLAEDAALPCSPPVRPRYYLLKAAGPLQPGLTGGEVSKIIKFLQVL